MTAYGIACCTVVIMTLACRCVQDKCCSPFFNLVCAVWLYSTSQHEVWRRADDLECRCARHGAFLDLIIVDVRCAGGDAECSLHIGASAGGVRWWVVLAVRVVCEIQLCIRSHVTPDHICSARAVYFEDTSSPDRWNMKATDWSVITPCDTHGSPTIVAFTRGWIHWFHFSVEFIDKRVDIIDSTGEQGVPDVTCLVHRSGKCHTWVSESDWNTISFPKFNDTIHTP